MRTHTCIFLILTKTVTNSSKLYTVTEEKSFCLKIHLRNPRKTPSYSSSCSAHELTSFSRMIFRYELFWLPLLAQHPSVDLAAPLDIAWVWHVHMLSPLSYDRDCNEIVSALVDHRILVGKAREKGLKKARALWNQEYPREPFEVDLNALSHVCRISSQEFNMTSRALAKDKECFIIKFPCHITRIRHSYVKQLRGISTICSSSKRIKMLFLYHAMTLTLSGMLIK